MPDTTTLIWRRQMRLVNAPLEAIFVQEFTKLLEQLRQAMTLTPGAPPFDLNEWKARLSDGMLPFYQLAFTTGGRNILLTSPSVRSALEGDKGAMAWMLKQEGGVTATTARKLSRRIGLMVQTYANGFEELLAESVALGLDGDEIQDLVDEEWSDIFGTNVPGAAITETQVGVNSARAYVAQRVVDLWTWGTAEDERVRPNHVTYGEADPKPVGFNWATLVRGSYTLRFPADPECTEAGEVVNCRCLTIPAGDIELSPEELEGFLGDFGLEASDLFQAESQTPGWVAGRHG